MNRFAAVRTGGILLATLFLASRPTLASELVLKGGGRVSGIIVERTATSITLETSPGRVTLALSRVEKVSDERSALEVWRERSSALAADDLEGWAALARWAGDRQLMTQAREGWQHVLSLDPRHVEANVALGRVQVDGAWMNADDAYRARGYLPFEGRWVSPAEREVLEQERRAEEEQAMLRRAQALQAREAEARAREAEARARQAETAGEGIPLWWGGGTYLPVDAPWRDGHRHGHGHDGPPPQAGPAPHAPPPTSVPPSSIGGGHSSGAGSSSGHGPVSSR